MKQKDISYFEFEGQGILVVNQNNDQEIYLSKGAAAILKTSYWSKSIEQ